MRSEDSRSRVMKSKHVLEKHADMNVRCVVIKNMEDNSNGQISENTPTGASKNPKNFDLNKTLNLTLI